LSGSPAIVFALSLLNAIIAGDSKKKRGQKVSNDVQRFLDFDFVFGCPASSKELAGENAEGERI